MRVILLTHGGAELVLEELSKLKNIEIVGVFIETATTPNRPFKEKIKRSIRYDGYFETAKKLFAKVLRTKTTGEEEEKIVASSRELTESTARKLGIEVFNLENYHHENALGLMRNANADLGIIYGTNIIKESVFSIPKFGSINLHQGLAPFYRGGPPVFWELFNDEKEVGLTVHFVAAKVDTGDIILQKTVPLEYDFSFGDDFESFLEKYKEGLRYDCAKMVAEAVDLIVKGNFPRIKQDTTLGKRYRLPIKKEKDEMRKRLQQRQKNA
ncbi:MAG TPA: formyltransferase family protein [Pyrinomonadaceae bacterium]|nr:formyltransferase family protein [Pyrinomonadaceae bacterium]